MNTRTGKNSEALSLAALLAILADVGNIPQPHQAYLSELDEPGIGTDPDGRKAWDDTIETLVGLDPANVMGVVVSVVHKVPNDGSVCACGKVHASRNAALVHAYGKPATIKALQLLVIDHMEEEDLAATRG